MKRTLLLLLCGICCGLPFSAACKAKVGRTVSDTRLLQDPDKQSKPVEPHGYRFALAPGDTKLAAGDTCAPHVDNGLLTREMNKRERKKFGFGK